MAKYIFYILLGLFLLSKFASAGGDDKGECKISHTIDLQYSPEYEYSEPREAIKQYSKENCNPNYSNQANVGYIGASVSLCGTSPFKLLRTESSFVLSQIAKAVKTLLPEEKTNSFPFHVNPVKVSYRYYIYSLRRILI